MKQLSLEQIYSNNLKKRGYGKLLPIIRGYAEDCKDIKEIGVGEGKVSSALLMGCDGQCYGYDILSTKKARRLKSAAIEIGKDWVYTYGHGVYIELEETDMLVIDAVRQGNMVWSMLYDSGKMVNKRILLLGTKRWGEVGEFAGLGINYGIEKYITEFGGYKVSGIYDEGIGMTVLERDYTDDKT